MLKGKAKEDFEKWLKEPVQEHGRYGQLVTNTFKNMPLSMKWGVYLEFFDSVDISVGKVGRGYNNYFLIQKSNMYHTNTRKEAQQIAIEKAVEIYNSRYGSK